MELNECLIEWYNANKRPLPFREKRDPYAIWVSEIMAQQTRIDSMIPYYHRWMEKWPTIESLAKAELDDVLQVWQGLGYYNRARKLHEGAKTVVETYSGKLPADIEELKKIPGIGFYTAGAIGSIAFGLRAPAVDGNVLRVTTRICQMDADITKKTTVDQVYQIVYDWMQNSDASSFTQGLMELGALICTPKNPSCLFCPLNHFCKSYAAGTQLDYPIKKAAKKPVELNLKTYLIDDGDSHILLSEDWSDGLMVGLLRLPQFAEKKKELEKAEFVEKRKHVFSHRIWNMDCYRMTDSEIKLENTRWIDLDELDSLAIVTAHRKWLEEWRKNHDKN